MSGNLTTFIFKCYLGKRRTVCLCSDELGIYSEVYRLSKPIPTLDEKTDTSLKVKKQTFESVNFKHVMPPFTLGLHSRANKRFISGEPATVVRGCPVLKPYLSLNIPFTMLNL